MFSDTPEGFRSGFVSFVGRPNTGKSTLTNALVGQKIAITADQPETTRHPIRGIVHREAALSGLKHELPHSVAVEIDEVLPDQDREGVLNVHAVLYVERPGQKSIIAGKDGRRLSGIVHRARLEIIKLLNQNIYLDLRIKVLKNWQSDPKALGRLGF